jgi:hypothetical protein
MANAVVKTSKVIKGMTTNIRSSFDVFDRARDVYLAQIKRAEMDYFERIRRATAVLTGEAEAHSATSEQQEAAN